MHFAPAKGKSLASSQDRGGSQESQAFGGCEQANLELDRQDLGATRRERHSRVAAGAIGDAADHTRMDIAVLLGKHGRKWHRDVNMTGFNKLERRSERLHESLPRKTASNFVRSSQSRSEWVRPTELMPG